MPVSWNFRQIVALDCIHTFNAVNLRMGCPILEIGEEEIANESGKRKVYR